MQDLYATLGINKTASQEEIKNAYRKLAKKYHPDLNPGNKEAERRFKEATEANDILSDPKKKEEYDRFGTVGQQGSEAGRHGPFYYETQGGPGGRYSQQFYSDSTGGFDEDWLRSFFGGGARGFGEAGGFGQGTRSRRRTGPIPGDDEQYSMEVDLRDIITGSEREINLPNGKRLRVKIPKGIESGTKLRFAGMGGPGISGGPSGDAYVEINVRPSKEFRQIGKNIEIDLPISINEAVLGTEARVPTLTGLISMKIPPGVSTGSKLRIRGKGIPDRSGASGDQYVVIKIAMPKQIDGELRAFMEKWQKDHPYNPREESSNAA